MSPVVPDLKVTEPFDAFTEALVDCVSTTQLEAFMLHCTLASALCERMVMNTEVTSNTEFFIEFSDVWWLSDNNGGYTVQMDALVRPFRALRIGNEARRIKPCHR